ncbi:phosphatase PAP2 family protein [Alteromonas facilis]|uniref:phosphatase PAP2 family protein n=1 Tax=Alteromonas facilis TaxID=2048004 RepID=UPI000C28F990|nr:phosphatase PAP2 family protein [Alteromonas facilis]
MNTIQSFGVDFILMLQSHQGSIGGLMDVLSLFVKAELAMVFLMPLLFWLVSPRLLGPLFLLMMFEIMLGDILKVVLAQPRPFWLSDALLPLDAVTSLYSSPGGYASFATVFWGALFLQTRKRWTLIVGIPFVLLTSLSKMYHASMAPDHMLLGVLQGIIVLMLVQRFKDRLTATFLNASVAKLGVIAVGFVGAMYVAIGIAFWLHSHYQIPLQYLEYKMVPAHRLAGGGITLAAGLFVGAAIGYKKYVSSGEYDLSLVSVWHKIMLAVIGLAGMIVIMAVLRPNLAGSADSRVSEWLFNMVFSFAAGYWVFYGALSTYLGNFWLPRHKINSPA